jgi:hypothetical protein
MREPEGPAHLWIIIVAYLWLNTAVAPGAWDGPGSGSELGDGGGTWSASGCHRQRKT